MASIASTSVLFVTLLQYFLVIGTLNISVCNGDHGKKISTNNGDQHHSSPKHHGDKIDDDEGDDIHGLKMKNFYRKSCPNVDVEKIVESITWKNVGANPSLGAKLLRIHYHDCFVRGCDASLLLDPTTNEATQVEKEARPNLSLTGYEVIDEIKTRLEQECPGTVSCADIVALAARDGVSFQFQKQMWKVPLGRRDGRVSLASEALTDLPSASSNFTTLLRLFSRKGLDKVDLVALSGAHTIGIAHCGVISRRLFNFTGKGDTDPSIEPAYAEILKAKCTTNNKPSSGNIIEMDPNSSIAFDNHYYININEKKGVFQSDAALLTDSFSATLVKEFENGNAFLANFAKSMVNMGAMEVLTREDQGEIRKQCRFVN
ncbi:hypothetical protein C5167_012182 [Papaver somniferum]|uniref:Peroxidase n=1 Tax=Papaver somniferum TaxID=3469 RepID=A0A4Y7J0P4_PAPSO|nr:peroxidase 24-like [Papaver somniferum]RZC53329.1 hypothetical protein C5167_012182 [Papaver somniferum]